MSLESAASSGGTRSSGGGDGGGGGERRQTRGLSRGAVLKKLGQQTELSRKTSTTTSSCASLIMGDLGNKLAPQPAKGHTNFFLLRVDIRGFYVFLCFKLFLAHSIAHFLPTPTKSLKYLCCFYLLDKSAIKDVCCDFLGFLSSEQKSKSQRVLAAAAQLCWQESQYSGKHFYHPFSLFYA